MTFDEDPYNPLYDPDDPQGVASPPDVEDLRETEQFPLDSPEYPDALEADENTCASCGTTIPPDRSKCEFCQTENVPTDSRGGPSNGDARAEYQTDWVFDHVIHAIVEAGTYYEAVAKASVAFRQRIDGSLPNEVLDETFELVYDFDEDPAAMLTRRWGDLPGVAPLTSEVGDNLLLTAYELTDWIEDDSNGSAIYLYDEWGMPIHSREQLGSLLITHEPIDEEAVELWIVPALGYKPTTKTEPERTVFRGPERALRECWSCREETAHQFVEMENLPEEAVSNAIWECRRCGAPTYGPEP